MQEEIPIDNIRFLEQNRGFLGREFLTWLWFKSEQQKHRISLPNYGDFELFIDDKIILSSASGSVRENSLRGGTPAYAQEAGSALLSGKMVQSAKFILQNTNAQWVFTICADDFSLRSVRVPHVTKESTAEHFVERITHFQFLNDILDELYKDFVKMRLTPAFELELQNLKIWMDEKVAHGI